MSGEDFKIEREGGFVYISHPRWSLVGMGPDLPSAARDLDVEMVQAYAHFAGRDDLSAESQRMVAYITDLTGLKIYPRTHPDSPPSGAP